LVIKVVIDKKTRPFFLKNNAPKEKIFSRRYFFSSKTASGEEVREVFEEF